MSDKSWLKGSFFSPQQGRAHFAFPCEETKADASSLLASWRFKASPRTCAVAHGHRPTRVFVALVRIRKYALYVQAEARVPLHTSAVPALPHRPMTYLL